MDVIDYWDSESGCQKQRFATLEEQAEIDARRFSIFSIEVQNAPILAALADIDKKTPRAVREAFLTGDNSRVLALENEAVVLRAQLVKA